MTQTANPAEGPLVLVGAPNGHALISYGTPLTRLNYFDGKFLRAEDLNREQFYLRSLVELSNQAGGTGVVHGFTTLLGSSGMLQLSPGLAIDPAGRVLLLAHDASISIPELIQKSRELVSGATTTSGGGSPAMGEGSFAPCQTVTATPPTVTTTFPTDLYLIALTHAEALCGQEDVYGKLCEDACVTSTDRPLRKEGVVVRAIPLVLCPPTCTATWLSAKHRRSQVASAYYATERALLGKNMSGARLKLDLWCHGAAGQSGTVVPLAVVSVNGTTVEFLDAWSARRERIEAPPRRFWAWQMMMRPYNVFLAQVLQFQCHLHEVLTDPANDPGGGTDPCANKNAALQQAVSLMEEMERSYAAAMAEAGGSDVFRPDFLTEIAQLKAQVGTALIGTTEAPPGTRILIDGGIVELPPAGYLPVVPGGLDVNAQVRALLGDGVDLRFCIVRPDYVAHALEEAQHLERICLLAGIDNPAAAQEVDILVPDGTVMEKEVEQGHYFETTFAIVVPSPDILGDDDDGSSGSSSSSSSSGFSSGSSASSSSTGFGGSGSSSSSSSSGSGTPTQGGSATLQGPQFRGAGRSETLATGGGAFHFAGLLTQPIDQLVTGVGRKYQTAYNRNSVDVESGLSRSQSTVGINLSMLGADRIAQGISSMRTKTAEKQGFADTSGAARTMNTLNTQSQYTSGIRTGASTSPPAIWTTMRCDRDPFAMPIGASSPIRLEAAAGASIMGYTAGAQLILQGDLFCDQSTTTATGKKVTGRAWGWVYAHARLAFGTQEQVVNPAPIFIPVNAEIELKPATTGGGTLAVTITTQQGFEFSVTTEWKSTPILATSSVTIDLIDTLEAILMERAGDDQEKVDAAEALIEKLEDEHPELHALEVARAALKENPAVREESNSHHAAAVKAIRTIATALDDEGFQQSATALLFTAPPPKKEKKFIATRDWVLFHRRRTSSCDCCQPEKKVIAPPRRYQVYEITVPGDGSVEDIREALARGEDLTQYSAVVGVAEFEGETATFTGATSPVQLREGWNFALPGSAILYGAIASEGAAINDGDDLDEQRVGRVADVVRSITPITPGTPFEVLPLVPVGVSAAGLDGVILLFTITAEVQTQRHRVYTANDNGVMEFLIRSMDQNNLAGALAQVAQVLGDVDFEEDSATVVDNSLQPVEDAWIAIWGPARSVGRAMVVLPSQSPISTATAELQGGAIAAERNGTLTEQTRTSPESTLFAGIEAITILEPGDPAVT